MESGKQQPPIADVESQSTTTPPPARPAFLLLWLLFVLGTVGTIVSSNWNKPDFPIHATNILVKSSATTTGTPLPTSAPTSTCDHLTLRREWRNFKPSEQSKYKTALRCLADLPSKNGNGNRLSDFLSAYHYSGWHTSQTSNYLLWNRWYLHNLETALRSQCGYTGDMAYLDWTIPAPEAQAEKEVAATYTSQTTLRETRASKQHLDARIEAAILAAADYDDFVHRLEMRITDLAPFDFSNPDLPLGTFCYSLPIFSCFFGLIFCVSARSPVFASSAG